jgi:uncharacterized membrane protein
MVQRLTSLYMSRRSPLQAFLAAALAAVLVSGYAGPAVCAAVHSQPASQSEHCPDGAGHGNPDEAATSGPTLTGVAGTVGCPDAAHCGAGLAGPVLRRASFLLLNPPDAGPAPAPAIGGHGVLTGPPSPPPKV